MRQLRRGFATDGSFIARGENRAVMFSFAMAYATLTEKLLAAVTRFPSERAVLLRVNGVWEPTSSGEFLRRGAGGFNSSPQLSVKPRGWVWLLPSHPPAPHTHTFAL